MEYFRESVCIHRSWGRFSLKCHSSHSTIILPVVLCGSEILSVTAREEHSVRVFENSVLSRVFRAQKDEVRTNWTETHISELRNLWATPHQVLLEWPNQNKSIDLVTTMGTAVAQWLRCCATNRKVAGSIAAGVIGIFHWHNPSDRTMALGSTQPLTEIRGSTVVKVLCYKSKSRWFDRSWCHWNFSLT